MRLRLLGLTPSKKLTALPDNLHIKEILMRLRLLRINSF